MKKLIILFSVLVSSNSFSQTTESFRLKAKTYFENGKYNEAITALTSALKLNPKEVKALKNRAICYERTDKYELALKDNLEVLKLDQSVESYGSIGFDYLWLDKYEDARKFLKLAINLLPNNVNYLYNIGLSYQYEKNYDEALKYYDEVLKISKSHSPSKISKTRCFLYLNQFEKASAQVDSFFINKEFNVEMLLFRGDVKQHFGKIEEALGDFSRALAINPNDLLYLNRAANCLEDLEYYEEETEVRKRLVDEMEKQGETNEYKAISYGMLGIAQYNSLLWEDALESLNKSIKLDDSNRSATIYFYRTMVKAKLKDNEGACNDLKKAQELNPEEADNYENFFVDIEDYKDFYEYCFPNP